MFLRQRPSSGPWHASRCFDGTADTLLTPDKELTFEERNKSEDDAGALANSETLRIGIRFPAALACLIVASIVGCKTAQPRGEDESGVSSVDKAGDTTIMCEVVEKVSNLHFVDTVHVDSQNVTPIGNGKDYWKIGNASVKVKDLCKKAFDGCKTGSGKDSNCQVEGLKIVPSEVKPPQSSKLHYTCKSRKIGREGTLMVGSDGELLGYEGKGRTMMDARNGALTKCHKSSPNAPCILTGCSDDL